MTKLNGRSSCSCSFRTSSDIHAPLATDYTICDSKSRTKFVFSLHDARKKIISNMNDNFIGKENHNELIPD